MRFEERDLKPYAEPVTANLLKEGESTSRFNSLK